MHLLIFVAVITYECEDYYFAFIALLQFPFQYKHIKWY